MEMEQEKSQKDASVVKKPLIAVIVVSFLVIIALVIVIIVAFTGNKQVKHVTEAVCHVRPNPSSKLDATISSDNPIQGTVKLVQKMGEDLSVSLDLTGFKAESAAKKHGFHVHQSGDIVTNGCQSAKGHFNPEKKKHGSIDDEERHVGDWGNILVPANGNIQHSFVDKVASLTGARGVLGRAIVIHQGEDDLGKGGHSDSLTTGHAGARLACCVIVPEN